ncbi:MAG: hypothetical protein JXB85_07090 [Anaerolineales bacterium]|nr:hypothetical protein [Anaerolineales bacterium]
MDKSNPQTDGSIWNPLFKIGAIAPLVTLAVYLTQSLSYAFGPAIPATQTEWFAVYQQNKLLGLLYLNAFDTFSIAILGLMFLAVFVALKDIHPTTMALAAFFAFLGISVFVTTRAFMVSAFVSLNARYAAATSDVLRGELIAAGQAILSPARATPETIGFLFLAVAGLLISLVMRRSQIFGGGVFYVGILGCVLTFADQISLVLAPSLARMLMPVNGFLWLVWWLLISRGLFRLAKNSAHARV